MEIRKSRNDDTTTIVGDGKVGAGIIFVSIGYGLGGPLLAISLLTILTNLILTGGFVVIVKRLALKAEKK